MTDFGDYTDHVRDLFMLRLPCSLLILRRPSVRAKRTFSAAISSVNLLGCFSWIKAKHRSLRSCR